MSTKLTKKECESWQKHFSGRENGLKNDINQLTKSLKDVENESDRQRLKLRIGTLLKIKRDVKKLASYYKEELKKYS